MNEFKAVQGSDWNVFELARWYNRLAGPSSLSGRQMSAVIAWPGAAVPALVGTYVLVPLAAAVTAFLLWAVAPLCTMHAKLFGIFRQMLPICRICFIYALLYHFKWYGLKYF